MFPCTFLFQETNNLEAMASLICSPINLNEHRHCLYFLVIAILFSLFGFYQVFPNNSHIFKLNYLEGIFPRKTDNRTEIVDEERQLRTSSPEIALVVTTDETLTKMPKEPKLLLMWTPFFGSTTYPSSFFPDNEIIVDNLRCQITKDKSRLADADGVVFHGRDFNGKYTPKKTNYNQMWIYYLLESPVHSGCSDSCWRTMNKIGFNWYMGYHRTNAHSFFPYGKLLENDIDQDQAGIESRIKKFAQSFGTRSTDAVWIVSNCK